MDLKIERFSSSKEGVYVSHERSKQRSDKRSSRFLIPRSGVQDHDWAALVEQYLVAIKDDINKYTGRVFWGARGGTFIAQPLGRNMVGQIPHEMAKFLEIPTPKEFTFHSFRRSAATAAADTGASSAQMTDFFGWKNPSMPQEYISTSKAAVNTMANLLSPSVPDPAEENTGPIIAADYIHPELEMNAADESGGTSGSVFDQQAMMRLVQHNQKVVFVTNFSGTMNI